MFGEKINEFDNSNGTIESFNKIFPRTILGKSLGAYVEIGNIVEYKKDFGSSTFVRYLSFYDNNWNLLRKTEFDFGYNNFIDSKDFVQEGLVRYKYIAKDLNNNLLAIDYNLEQLSKKLNCSENLAKNRVKQKVNKNTDTKYKFNIRRIEL